MSASGTVRVDRTVIYLLAGVIVVLLLYHVTIAALWGQWTAGLYGQAAHGLPLFAVIVFLMYRRWSAHPQAHALRVTKSALVPIAGLSLLWALAALADVQSLQYPLVLGILIGLFWFMFGYRCGSMLAWPLLLLLTAFPVWDPLYPILKEITTATVVPLLNAIGIPAVREGFFVSVPAGDFEIEDACAGIALTTSSFAISGLYAYVAHLTPVRSIILVLGGLAVAVLANILRVFTVIWIGQHWGMDHAWVADHGPIGWWYFAIGITALLYSARWWLEPRSDANRTEEPRPARQAQPRKLTGAGMLAASVVALTMGPALVALATLRTSETPPPTGDVPQRLGDWVILDAAPQDWRPEFSGADRELRSSYRDPTSARVDVYLAFYAYQQQGREAVHDGNHVYQKKLWHPDGHGRYVDAVSAGREFPVREQVLRGSRGDRRLVWHWYVVDGRPTGSRLTAKLRGALAALRGDRSAQAVVVSARVGANIDAARDALRRFTNAAGQQLASIFQQQQQDAWREKRRSVLAETRLFRTGPAGEPNTQGTERIGH